MIWKFVIQEESSNHYCVKGMRESVELIVLEGGESVIPRMLKEAYVAELNRGTIHGDAAFQVASSFLKTWPAIYYENMMGCWTVGEELGYPRIDYDGRDYYLMVSENSKKYSWQGHIDRISKGRSGFFEKLVKLSEDKEG